jgi:hypothetical protein
MVYLVKLLRTIFLQGSVFLHDLYPTLFIWKQPIFEMILYQEFVKDLKDSVSNSSVPEEERLQHTVPLLAGRLTNQERYFQINIITLQVS